MNQFNSIIITLINLHYILLLLGMVFIFSIPQLTSAIGKYGKTNSLKPFEAHPYFKPTLEAFKNLTVPKAYFKHYYWFASIWHFFFWSYSITLGLETQLIPCLLKLLLQIQFLRRLYEIEFLQKISLKPRMHLSHYIFGLTHYFCLTLIPQFTNTSSPPVNYYRLFIAISLFIWGSYNQYQSHLILASLRHESSDTYYLPEKGYFQYSSSPHYFFEIIIYTSYLLIGYNMFQSLWLVWAFVCFNLSASGYFTHQWYLKNFPEKREIIKRRHFILVR